MADVYPQNTQVTGRRNRGAYIGWTIFVAILLAAVVVWVIAALVD